MTDTHIWEHKYINIILLWLDFAISNEQNKRKSKAKMWKSAHPAQIVTEIQ